MKCPICRNGETHAGEATVPLERGGVLIIVRGAPAQICNNCGEPFHDEGATAALLTQAEQAATTDAVIAVRRFGAAP